jgi:quercetin dioxygenase-like cupin family protein
MNDLKIPSKALHVTEPELLKRSRWYGPNLFTFLATAKETNGTFSLLKCVVRKGFEPPLHMHTREDESYMILDGEIIYQNGDQKIHARKGDFIQMPKNIPHKFKLVSETVTFLLFITPGGFEELFWQFSRPAESMEPAPIPDARPDKAFFEAMEKLGEKLGVTMFPDL